MGKWWLWFVCHQSEKQPRSRIRRVGHNEVWIWISQPALSTNSKGCCHQEKRRLLERFQNPLPWWWNWLNRLRNRLRGWYNYVLRRWWARWTYLRLYGDKWQEAEKVWLHCIPQWLAPWISPCWPRFQFRLELAYTYQPSRKRCSKHEDQRNFME